MLVLWNIAQWAHVSLQKHCLHTAWLSCAGLQGLRGWDSRAEFQPSLRVLFIQPVSTVVRMTLAEPKGLVGVLPVPLLSPGEKVSGTKNLH